MVQELQRIQSSETIELEKWELDLPCLLFMVVWLELQNWDIEHVQLTLVISLPMNFEFDEPMDKLLHLGLLESYG